MPQYLPILIIAIAALLALAVMAFLLIRSAAASRQIAQSALQDQLATAATQQQTQLAQLNQQLTLAIQNLNTGLNQRLAQSQSLAQQTQTAIAQRLDTAGKTVADLKGQLGQLSQATANIAQVGSEVRKLQDILQTPKLRGGLGEWSLENLLAEVLPRQHYQLQHKFSNGQIVDALVRLANGSVPIDAKFPLANFQNILAAPDEPTRSKARRAFLRDVRSRIDEIAQKYIVPAEGTLDFALMYVPAENVYYQAVVTVNPDDIDISAHGRANKVIPVSPNTLYAYLMVIATGLKGLQIEKNAQFIRQSLTQCATDLQLFINDFATIGKHLTNAKTRHDQAARQIETVARHLHHVQTHSPSDTDAYPPADPVLTADPTLQTNPLPPTR